MDDTIHSISPHHIDYGAKAADYVGVFMAAINWPAVRRAHEGVRP